MDKLIEQTQNINDAFLLVVIAALCAYILLQNKIIRDQNKDYSNLVKDSTVAMTELATLLKGYLMK